MIDETLEQRLEQAGLTRNTSYELFMLIVSLISLVNLLLLALPFGGEVNDVIAIIDRFTAVLFLVDFIRRLMHAKSKRRYFFQQRGWADFLASIPISAFNIFRIFRILRFVRVYRMLGRENMTKLLTSRPADAALYIVFLLIVLVLEFGSVAILVTEQHLPEANIKTASDALWWVFVSITTVGYGDKFPVTNQGRLIGVVTLTVGVGLFGVVTGYLANLFLGHNKR